MDNQAQIPDLANLKRVAEACENTFAELCKTGGDDLAEAWDKAELEFMDVANSTAVLALICEIQTLRPDAERYRWLNRKAATGPNICVSEWIGPHEYPLIGPALDAAIDAAMGSGERS